MYVTKTIANFRRLGDSNNTIIFEIAQLIGRLFSPSQKVKKLSHPGGIVFSPSPSTLKT